MPRKWLLVRNQDQVILTNNFRKTRVGHLFWNPSNDGNMTDWLYTGVQIQSEILSSLNYEVCTHHFNQRTSDPVNAHLISWLSKAQNIQNLENIC